MSQAKFYTLSSVKPGPTTPDDDPLTIYTESYFQAAAKAIQGDTTQGQRFKLVTDLPNSLRFFGLTGLDLFRLIPWSSKYDTFGYTGPLPDVDDGISLGELRN